MNDGIIRSCRVNAKIVSLHSSGGFVAEMKKGLVENCTTEKSTEITAPQYIGGIVGYIKAGTLHGNTWPSDYDEAGQRNIITPALPSLPDTWNGHRYQIFTEALSWKDAKSYCESLGGHLATITSQEEQNIIALLISDSQGNSFWLGASSDESGWWHWVTNEVLELQYQNYVEGQPDGSGIYLQIDSSWRWDDVPDSAQGFICEWDDEPAEVEAAPLASEFVKWLADPELRAGGDGANPSPIDRSHLKNNPPRVSASSVFSAATDSLPRSYDARIAIGLPEARDQGNYDTCWAFATLGAMEANYRRQGLLSLGEYPDLSEFHLAYFTYATIYSNDIDEAKSILNQGGTPDIAANFLTTTEPAPINESDMPYSQTSNSKYDINADKTFNKLPISLAEANPIAPIDRDNIPMIKDLIMKHGAVYFHYLHNKNDYDDFNHSYYSTSLHSPHAALLVGWDDDYLATNFKNAPSSDGAWLVCNSWGKNWGENGYFWMSYEQGINSVMDNCYVFIVSEDILDETQESHLHDEGGETKNITPQWSANIFQAERNESIVVITFNTTDNNAEYQIYVNNLGKERPSDPGGITSEAILSGTMLWAGYHTLMLPEPIDLYAGDYYSLIVKMTTLYDYPTAAEGTVEGFFSASVGEGESYFASGDAVPSVWVDGKHLNGESYNATLRAITIARKSYEVKPSITTASIPEGKTGELYEFQLEAQGSGVIEWRAGRLPEGFSLSRGGMLRGQSASAIDEKINLLAFNDVGITNATFSLRVKETTPKPSDDPEHNNEQIPIVPNNEDASSGGGGCNVGSMSLLGMLGIILLLSKRR